MIDQTYEGDPAQVRFEPDTSSDPENFGNLYVHVASGGLEYIPGRVFRSPAGICFELWPIPKKLIMTLPELRALVAEIEKWQDNLPYDDVEPGIG